MIDLPVMITLPLGRFIMGTVGDDRFANSTERPPHEVIMERPFSISRFPITESQWHSWSNKGTRSSLPVVNITWTQAAGYAAWLRDQTRSPYRLVSEAEWEYACRASSTTIFTTGDDIDPSQANYFYDEHGFKVGPGQRTPQGSYPANAWGLEDMHGNVCEWVADAWRPTYHSAPELGLRVIRGGAWDYLPRLLRSAWRDSATPDTRRDNLGFRVACDL